LKVIIAAAAPNPPGYGFPRDSKPRCLYHFNGEVILTRMVKMLHSFGLYDIRIVTGYKHEMVEQFVKEKKLKVELAYSPNSADAEWVTGGWTKGSDTIKAGLKNVDDDIILVFGDVSLCADGIPKLLASKHRFAFTRSGHGVHTCRFPRDILPELRKIEGIGFGNRLLACIGVVHFSPEWELAYREKGIDIIWTSEHDIDTYRATDEGQAWHLSLLGLDRKFWNSLSLAEQRQLCIDRGIRVQGLGKKILFLIEGCYGTGRNKDFYGVDLGVSFNE